MQPDVSVIIPARNERATIVDTIIAISRARSSEARLEFIVVDDASTDGSVEALVSAAPALMEEPRVDVRVWTHQKPQGVYRARNRGASLATSDVLFFTDAHVRMSVGWDERILEELRPDRLLAGTIVQDGTAFRGYGCSLLVPVMGTTWNLEPAGGDGEVPIAPCAATAMPRELFHALGGYDEGMRVYGGGEPEFSVRAWLHGARVISVPDLEVQHDFKSRAKHSRFLESIRLEWVHNCLRFGLLYLSELGCMQLLRYHALAFPDVYQAALRLVDSSGVFRRRARLARSRQHSFRWFVRHFAARNQQGRAFE